MKRAQRLLVAAMVIALLCGGLYLLLFRRVELPGTTGAEPQIALVMKNYQPAYLESGDWVLVEFPNGTDVTNSMRRLGRIQLPDPTQAPRNRKRIARKIMEMDFKPTYFVSASGGDTNQLVEVPEYRIKGKAVHIFTR